MKKLVTGLRDGETAFQKLATDGYRYYFRAVLSEGTQPLNRIPILTLIEAAEQVDREDTLQRDFADRISFWFNPLLVFHSGK
jgi:hypothetical protein